MKNFILFIIPCLIVACGLPPEPDLSSVLTSTGPTKFVTEADWDALAAQRSTTCPGIGASNDQQTRQSVVSCNKSLQYYDRLSTNTNGSGIPGSCTGQILAPVPCDLNQFDKFLPEELVADLKKIIEDPSQPVYLGQLDQCILISDPSDSRIANNNIKLDITQNAIFICHFATPSKTNSGSYDFSQNLIIPLNIPVPEKFYN